MIQMRNQRLLKISYTINDNEDENINNLEDSENNNKINTVVEKELDFDFINEDIKKKKSLFNLSLKFSTDEVKDMDLELKNLNDPENLDKMDLDE